MVRIFQAEVKVPDSKKLRLLAALTNIQTPLVIVIAQHGQRAKLSHMFLNLLLMNKNGLIALLKAGKS